MGIDRKKIERELESLVDPVYRKGMETAVPTSWRIRGVRVGELKRIAREAAGGPEGEGGYRDALCFLDRAFAGRDRELAIIGINVLTAFKRLYDEALVGKVREWIGAAADWEVSDNLSYLIIPDLLERGLFTDRDLLFLRDHENPFARRAFVVSRVKALRKGRGDVSAVLDDISFFAEDRDRYMVKALSWALREASKNSPEDVRRFLDSHGGRLHSSVAREVRSKLEKGTKR